jgi:hypothetical protein
LTPEVVQQNPTLRLGPDSEGRNAQFVAKLRPDGLEVGMVIEGLAGKSKQPPYPEWHYQNHAVFYFNPGLDHVTRWMYAVDSAGTVYREAVRIVPGEEEWDCQPQKLSDPPPAIGEFKRLDERQFFIRLFISAPECQPTPGAPVGLALKVGFDEERIVEPLVWPTPLDWCRESPFSFGTLYAPGAGVYVESLEAHEPSWGGSPCNFTLKGRTTPGGPQEGFVNWELVLPGDSTEKGVDISWRASNGVFEVGMPVILSHRAKWASNVEYSPVLKFSIKGRQGGICETVWEAQYPISFDAGIIVRDRFGGRLLNCLQEQGANFGPDDLPPRPQPNDDDFLNQFRNFIFTRLPDYKRRTTRDGARSDFFLEDLDGQAHLDLSAENYLERVAEMIAYRFPDWQDALCAVAAWASNPSITRHTGAWMRISGCVTLESVPRLGGCLCSDVSQLCASLSERVGSLLDVSISGFTLGLRGHVSTMLETPGGQVVIDGMLGQWYHRLDNSRLSTLAEMRTQRDIVRRVWFHPQAHEREFYFGINDQTIRRWRDRVASYP